MMRGSYCYQVCAPCRLAGVTIRYVRSTAEAGLLLCGEHGAVNVGMVGGGGYPLPLQESVQAVPTDT